MTEPENLHINVDPPLLERNIDYLIIGLGLCGTFLSYFLLNAGKKVLVIDEDRPFTASKIASGVINPVTGRRIVRTWKIEELLPFALQVYTDLGHELGADLIKNCPLLDFHPSLQMKEAFENRLTEEQEYLHTPGDFNWKQYFNYHFDIGEIRPCLLADINSLLTLWRQQLSARNCLLAETFYSSDCTIYTGHVSYKNVMAEKMIFCDGVSGADNPWFKNLPYAPNKGEALIAKIPGLPRQHIYKQGITIVPWQDDLFWIGSSYEWNFSDTLPTALFKDKLINQLRYWLKLPFEITDHIASVRPANMERRPFVGLHPGHSAVGILNGMGAKGCSLAPFFAKQLADHLVEGKPLLPEADVKRFTRILERKMD